MSKVIATIDLNNGEQVVHKFEASSIKNVYQTCRKNLGAARATTMTNNKLFWEFDHGTVVLEGSGFRHHHGYRTIKGRNNK